MPVPTQQLYAIYTLLGLVFGVSLERGRMCSVSAMNNLFVSGNTRIMNGYLVAFGVAPIFTGLLTSFGVVSVANATFVIPPLGWYIIAGGLILGIGSGLCGACTFGMMFRAGAGFAHNWIQLIGLIGGTAFFAYLLFPASALNLDSVFKTNFWLPPGKGNYFPALLFGDAWWGPALVGLLMGGTLLILALYLRRYTSPQERREPLLTKDMLRFRKPWNPYFAGLIMAGIMITSFVVGAGVTFNYVSVTTAEAQLLTYVLLPFGTNLYAATPTGSWYQTLPVVSPLSLLLFGVFVGAFVSAAVGGDFIIRAPRQKKKIVQYVIGGFLVGIGARLGFGCTIGTWWSGFAMLSPLGIIYTAPLFLGVWLALKIQERIW